MEGLPAIFMDLAVILVAAGVITVVFKWLKQPLVLGYIPRNAATHIQNTAPGPPTHIAVETPAILPVPMVAQSAMQKDLY